MTGDDVWCAVLSEVIDASHLVTASELVNLVNGACARVGLRAELFLADLSERALHPIGSRTGGPEQADEAVGSLSMEGTVAGRAFRFSDLMEVARPSPDGQLINACPVEDGGSVLWVPVVDGTDRVGVLRLELPADIDPSDTRLRARCWTLAGLLGHLIVAKRAYSDVLHQVRRTRPLSVASELLGQLLPPRTFAGRDLVVAAAMEPFDQVGGDGYDYAVDDHHHAYLAVFDSTGHDVKSGLITTTVLAATRNARRGGGDLAEMADAADQVLADTPLTGFCTALLATVDLIQGSLHYLLAGHPPPVLLRDHHAVSLPLVRPRPPLGIRPLGGISGLGTVALQPGDRILLHTDGITEARDDSGEFFGLRGLIDHTERHEAAGLSPPETLRRIIHAVLDHQDGRLQDDATLVLFEWSTTASAMLLPARS
ncbi:PP2C family protein-serine/threonine phosphatase [Lentzea sp. NPDC102401]|uniref:PP2C family protein-serine/threonine phosphatase n=1 Tax=Lentzea sp. NPDC102401 TaxID=3364128 RepID=UPI0037FEF257